MLLSYHFGKKTYYIPFEKLKLVTVVLVGIVLFFVSNSFSNFDLLPRIILKLLLIVVFPIILYYSNIFEEIEKQTAIASIRKIFKK
jgi:hypothetical protein